MKEIQDVNVSFYNGIVPYFFNLDQSGVLNTPVAGNVQALAASGYVQTNQPVLPLRPQNM